MSYLVLARKWRPQRFADIVGQRHVALTLTSAIENDRLSHAYLFTGPRGVGKTSMARILAKALNCEAGPASEPCNACAACQSITEGHCLDVLEIDGASNRGIDDVRQLRESVKYAPASVRAKVYIIDEVHMLTTDAFNALLKTLEEPPAHVYFIMATTEPLKVPATILSRCQRHDFGRLTLDELSGNLQRITAAEGIGIDEDALRLISRKAEGSVRDSLTLLDQVAASGGGPFTALKVQEILGLSGSGLLFEISAAVTAGDAARALTTLGQAYQEGVNLQELAEELVNHFRNVLLVAMGEALAGALEATEDEAAQLRQQVSGIRPADALRWLHILLDAVPRLRRSAHGRVHLEVALAEMASLPRAVDLTALLTRLEAAGPAGGEPQRRPGAVPDAVRERGPAAPAAPRRRSPPAEQAQAAASAAPPAARAAAPRAESAAGSLGADWTRMLEALRRGRAFLASCLHESEAVAITDGRLVVRLDDQNGFKREQIEKPGNRRHVLRLIEETFGSPLGLQLENVPSSAPPAAPAAPPPPQVRETSAEEGPGGPARIRKIAEMIDGDIIGPAR
jgi:DNA polymerase-3 subunit gamma/tau